MAKISIVCGSGSGRGDGKAAMSAVHLPATFCTYCYLEFLCSDHCKIIMGHQLSSYYCARIVMRIGVVHATDIQNLWDYMQLRQIVVGRFGEVSKHKMIIVKHCADIIASNTWKYAGYNTEDDFITKNPYTGNTIKQ